MRSLRYLLTALFLIVTLSGLLPGQQQPTQSADVVPRLVNYSGKATDLQGKPIAGVSGLTFAIYKDQQGGAPLWMETQNVTLDAKGNYTVRLGATRSDGLPLELFSSGDARWLGVRVNGDDETPRVLLLSVPYALKAADAETLGGKPLSAFQLATPTVDAPPALSKTPASNVITCASGSACAKSYIPVFQTNGGAAKVKNSTISQSGSFVTVAGSLSVNQGLTANGDSTENGNFTTNGNLTATGVVTGSSYQIGSNLFAFGSFSSGNAFLGFAGNSGMSGSINTASGTYALGSNQTGSANTASGYLALYANTTGNFNTASGSYALESNSSGSNDTAAGNEALNDNSTGTDNTAMGANALQQNTQGSENTAVGSGALYSNSEFTSNNSAIGYQALYSNTVGGGNTAEGSVALYSNTSGYGDLANGSAALYTNSSGYENVAEGSDALYFNTTGHDNTGVGVAALEDNETGHNLSCLGAFCSAGDRLFNATAVGAHAAVKASNSLVLGGTGEYAVNVGIGTAMPSNILTIARGAGHPVSDSWETYSSRRWKANIKTLPDALRKVERLRGVSYDLKDGGKHEIGVIAEEVGAVVPEVVSYEANGKDASGVDYSRLTALLIEAVKQQQKQIAVEREQIRRLRSKDAVLESKLTRLQGSVSELRRLKKAALEIVGDASAVPKAKF